MKFWALSYSLPAEPSRYRVAVWKKLKEMGAIYLQPGVAVLPHRENTFDTLKKLKEDIRTYNGKSALLTMDFTDKEDEVAMIGEINASRTEEYRGIARDTRRLGTLFELESKEGEADTARYLQELRRLRRRLEIAVGHDFFGADGRSEAEDALDILSSMLPPDTAKPRRRGKMPAPPAPATKPRPARPRPPRKPKPIEEVRPLAPVEPETPETPAEEDRSMPVFLF